MQPNLNELRFHSLENFSWHKHMYRSDGEPIGDTLADLPMLTYCLTAVISKNYLRKSNPELRCSFTWPNLYLGKIEQKILSLS